MAGIALADTSHVLKDVGGDTLEILAEFEPEDAKAFGLRVRHLDDSGVTITYNGSMLEVAGTALPFCLPDGEQTIKLHVFVDRSVLEVYANDCEAVTRLIDPGVGGLSVEIFANEGSMRVKVLDMWEMKSIWPE